MFNKTYYFLMLYVKLLIGQIITNIHIKRGYIDNTLNIRYFDLTS